MENSSVTDLGWLEDHRKRNRVTAKEGAGGSAGAISQLASAILCSVSAVVLRRQDVCGENITLPVIEHCKRDDFHNHNFAVL